MANSPLPLYIMPNSYSIFMSFAIVYLHSPEKAVYLPRYFFISAILCFESDEVCA